MCGQVKVVTKVDTEDEMLALKVSIYISFSNMGFLRPVALLGLL